MILKRIKNLWKLSEWEVDLPENLPVGTKVSMLMKEPVKMAEIIHRKNATEKFLEEVKEEN